jgi:pimeloyl-ACP methyl ester carboxylesterase
MKNMIMKTMGLYLNTMAFINPNAAAKKGLEIFCRPIRPSLNRKQMEFLETGKHITIEHEGIPIQTYKWGRGATKILFLHGWQSHTYRWKRYIDSFDKNEYTIHALDAPGHGLSGGNQLSVPLYSEVISNYVDQLGTVHALVCHSIGGFSALYTFYKRRELTSPMLILLAPPGEAAEFFKFYKNALGLSTRSERLIINRFEKVFGQAPNYFSAPYFASSVKATGLIIHDEEDKETSVKHAKRINANWKNSELQITKGLGHNLKSDEVVNSVIEFVIAGRQRVYNQNQLINQA